MITFYKETNFKETPIGKIPEDWEIVNLKGRVDIETGKRAKGGALDKGRVASIGGEHLDDEGNILWDEMKFIPEHFYNSLKQGKVRLGDILLVKDGATTGKVAFVRSLRYEKVAVNEHVFVMRSRVKELKNEFLFYFLFSKLGQIQIKTRFHGMIGGITRGDIETVLTTLPPLEEQEAIVRILSTVDKAILKTNEIIRKTERLKKGLMQELLTKGIGHKEFKDTEIGRIPKEWKIVRLNEISLIMDCKHRTPKYCERGYPVLLPRNVKEGKIFLQEAPKTTYEEFKDLTEKYKPQKGDIIYTRNAKVGVAGLVETNEPFALGQDLVGIRPHKNIEPKFLLYVLNSTIIRNYVLKLQTGSTFKRINLSLIRELPIPFPQFEEQEKIAKVLSAIDRKLETERKEKEKLEKIKRVLMDLLLTGKVRVKVS